MAIEVSIRAVRDDKGGMDIEMIGDKTQLLAMTATINDAVRRKTGMDVINYIVLMSQIIAEIDGKELGAYEVDVDEDALKEILKGNKDG